MERERNIEFVDSKLEKEEISGFSTKKIIDGSWLTMETFVKQIPFILFCVMLMLIYIGNRYNAEKVVRKNDKLKKELNNLRAEHITIASELINMNRPSKLQTKVEQKGLGLKFHKLPPKKIKRKR